MTRSLAPPQAAGNALAAGFMQAELTDRIAALILAAGYSSRMQGAFKPLLKIRLFTIVEHTIRTQQVAGISDIRVVVGHRGEEVENAAAYLGVRIVRNPHYDRGMFSSIQAGVASLPADIRAFFIMPVDIPFIHPDTLRTLLQAYHKNPGGIVYPTYGGQVGHPPLISGTYISEILASSGGYGLRGILAKHHSASSYVPVPDKMILMDIDTLQDYEHLIHLYNHSVSSENPQTDLQALEQGSAVERPSDREACACEIYGPTIPDRDQCELLLEQAHTPEAARAHGRQVTRIAMRLTNRINEAGRRLDTKLVQAAALLHDIKRDQKDHAGQGAALLEVHGYPEIAAIVATHMDLEPSEDPVPTEAEIVYLADKLVLEDRQTSLEDRFCATLNRCQDNEEACGAVRRRQRQAEMIKEKIERFIGESLDAILKTTPDDLVEERSQDEAIHG